MSVYQPDVLNEHSWLEYLLWLSLGAGVLMAALDLYYWLVVPFTVSKLPPQRRARDRSTCENTAL